MEGEEERVEEGEGGPSKAMEFPELSLAWRLVVVVGIGRGEEKPSLSTLGLIYP